MEISLRESISIPVYPLYIHVLPTITVTHTKKQYSKWTRHLLYCCKL